MRLLALLLGTSLALSGCAFVPEKGVEKDDAADTTNLQVISEGEWEDADGFHKASGTVTIYEGTDGAVVQFSDFEATNGPDVYLYASPHADANDLAGATKILVPEGEGDGRATLRGTFVVPLPDELEASAIASLVLWCDDFGVHFGTATLS